MGDVQPVHTENDAGSQVPPRRADAVVIGAGPAGLMAAEMLGRAGAAVVLAEAMPSPGRKFLMAGKSGLNLTMDRPLPEVLPAYAEAAGWLAPALGDFGPVEVQGWARDLGQEVFTGSSGRVFPRAMKASPLLRAWLGRLDGLGVRLLRRWRWTGWARDGATDDAAAACEARRAVLEAAGGPELDDCAGAGQRPAGLGRPEERRAEQARMDPATTGVWSHAAKAATLVPGSAGDGTAPDQTGRPGGAGGAQRRRPAPSENAPIPPHRLRFDTPQGAVILETPIVVLALGGASWARLGSDGAWAPRLAARGIPLAAFAPANAALHVEWSPAMTRWFGYPVKPLAIRASGAPIRGECVITARGLEGGAIYAASRAIREGALLTIDLAPDLTEAALAARLVPRLAAARPGDSRSTRLRKALRLDGARLALLQEFARPLPDTAEDLARLLKSIPVRHSGLRPMDEAISTAGGIRRSALTEGFELEALPGVFCAGEMLDWEAPTGGFLLTACLATGRAAGRAAAARFASGSANRQPATP